MIRIYTFILVLIVSVMQSAAVEIYEIQGETHKSPFAEQVVETSGIVTSWVGKKNFYLHSLQSDDSENTSNSILVFVRDNAKADELRATIPAGTLISLSGKVVEFQPFPQLPIPRWRLSIGPDNEVSAIRDESRTSFLTITELVDIDNIEPLAKGELPDPIKFSPPGAIGKISFADKPNTSFNADEHPRDYFESLEGMRVTIPNAITVGQKRRNWTSFTVASTDQLEFNELSNTKLPLLKEGHIYPEIIDVRTAFGQQRFPISPGTVLGDLTGVMSYQNGKYIVELQTTIVEKVVIDPPKDVVSVSGSDRFTVATINVKNLDPKLEVHEIPDDFTDDQKRAFARPDDDLASGKFEALADQIVNQLRSPTIIALQEIQDDDGTQITDMISASLTLDNVIAAIKNAGGPDYNHYSIDPPSPHIDGGQPGGNIRNAYLVRVDQGVKIKDIKRLFEDVATADNPFAGSRKPLEMMAEKDGKTYRFINVHLKSKLGNQGLYSNAEDPKNASTIKRYKQVEMLAAHVTGNSDLKSETIVILGDFNDYRESAALKPLTDSSLDVVISVDSRGEDHTYSHEFGGIRSAIDFIAVAGENVRSISETMYVSGNVDDLDGFTDHNPVWISFE